MFIRTAVLLSSLMTLCDCRHIVYFERETIHYEAEQSVNLVPGDEDVTVDIDAAEPLSHVEEYFISFTIDSQEFIEHFQNMNFRLLL